MTFIHHSGKNAALGARGHSSLRGAIDTEIEVVDNAGEKIATAEKQRDMEKGASFAFTLDVVELGINRRGEPVTSCVVKPVDTAHTTKPQTPSLTGHNKIGLQMLRRALDRHGTPIPTHPQYPDGAQAVTEKQWREVFYQGFPSDNDDTRRKTFNRVKAALLANQVVISMDNYVWPAQK